MVKVSCDKCGYTGDPHQPRTPLYSVDIKSMPIYRISNSKVFIDDTPMEERNHCICGKCLTKFLGQVASFFDSNMEDTQ